MERSIFFLSRFDRFAILSIASMPPTPSKLNLSFARNAYSVFGSRNATIANEHQREQKTELLEGKERGSKDEHNLFESLIPLTLNKHTSPFSLVLSCH